MFTYSRFMLLGFPFSICEISKSVTLRMGLRDSCHQWPGRWYKLEVGCCIQFPQRVRPRSLGKGAALSAPGSLSWLLLGFADPLLPDLPEFQENLNVSFPSLKPLCQPSSVSVGHVHSDACHSPAPGSVLCSTHSRLARSVFQNHVYSAY